MRERTIENAQFRLLATRYDLSRDSRLAREIVRHVNHALDRDERARQVRRVRPGELLLHTARGKLTLPIRTEEDLDRAIGGEGLRTIRRDIIVRLHLQGLTVLEISQRTYHAPRSVDAYLRTFDTILILHLYGLPTELVARVLGRGVYLVEEYLEPIRGYLKEPDQMRGYLRSRGVRVPRAELQHGV